MQGQVTLDKTLPILGLKSAVKQGKNIKVKFRGFKEISKLKDLMEGKKQKSDLEWGKYLGIPSEKVEILRMKMETGEFVIKGRDDEKSKLSRKR
ncbi:hypothetical protein [Methanococcus maripaludis]|uniref:Uncharacterized protein n=1 Tax=Methanococcus maripaludis TaxID=39152 RepID=A0A8T4CNV0_METMI|nr:hypothetical protein [Methanococcus maripaludis]MBM7408753.1 hypothetical protein [Methanococcus maripaludis]MBP2219078.1 hypothetical protein [Methanococcus maripaludis]